MRRVIVIGYGAQGHDWLDAVLTQVRGDPVLEALHDAEMLQLWSVGQTDPLAGIRDIRADAEADVLRGQLERGARAENRGRFGTIDLQTVLVLERWSLFDEAAVARKALRSGLHRATRVSAGEHATSSLDFEWYSLVDLARGPGEVAADTARRVQSLLAPDALPDRAFVIDRLDAGNGVISLELADRTFAITANAILSGELAFRTSAADTSAAFGTDGTANSVLPISVLLFVHDRALVSETIAGSLRNHLLHASLNPHIGHWAASIPALESLPALEADELRRGSHSRVQARRRRDRSAEELIRIAIATRDTSGAALQSIAQCRTAVKRHLGSGPGRQEPGVRQASMGALAMPIVGAGADALPWIGGALALAVGGFLLFRVVGTRRGAGAVSPSSVPAGTFDAEAASLSQEWSLLLDALEGFVSHWSAQVAKSRRNTRLGDLRWEIRKGTANEYLLSGAVPHDDSEAPVELGDLGVVARGVVQLLSDGNSPPDALQKALLFASSERVRDNSTAAVAIAGRALALPVAAPVADAIYHTPLMVNAPGAGTLETLWVVNDEVRMRSDLVSLEPPNGRDIVRFISARSRDRTVRLAVGKPVLWRSILSLSGLMQSPSR